MGQRGEWGHCESAAAGGQHVCGGERKAMLDGRGYRCGQGQPGAPLHRSISSLSLTCAESSNWVPFRSGCRTGCRRNMPARVPPPRSWGPHNSSGMRIMQPRWKGSTAEAVFRGRISPQQ